MTIHAGEAVVASLASANRDAAVFADADRLDLAHQDNPRVAFGHGIHHCLEAQLPRIELQVAMGARRLRPLIIQPVRPVAKDRSEPHGGQSRPSHPDRTSREAAARRLGIGPRE